MDGLVEQNSVLMHSKITEAGKRNGLINTRNLVAESRDGLVSVYPTPQYQSHRAGSLPAPRCPENGRSDPVQQLLDPSMLQQTVESHYRPNIILYSENVLRSWGESLGSECCETTFIEERSPAKDSLEYPDSKFIDLAADDIKIHTLSYEVEEEEDFQELEDVSRKHHHTWKEQAPWLSALGVPAKAAGWSPPRCGVPDLPGLPDGQGGRNRQKRFVLSGGRWDKTNLTYKIIRFPWQLVKAKVRRTIEEALKVWSDVTPLTFTEVQEGRADIVIDFTRYWHGDNLPFDGPGGILAHAFFPKTHREGDVHFDYDETWTIGNNLGTDLLQVAAHEFGHVLGLQHTAVSKSLMSPFYIFRYPLSLSEDDKQGIQYLYGKPSLDPAPTPTQPAEPPQPDLETNEITNVEAVQPDACHTAFDAAATIRGELFFFSARYVWRLRAGKLQDGYPALASRHWQGIPSSVHATFEDPLGNIWFFQDSQYWIYDGERQVSGPTPIVELGLPASPVQAALVWGAEKNKIYIFSGGNYWRFNPQRRQVDNIYPRAMADWRGVPAQIDAAFQDEAGFAYFLRGRDYWKFDPVQVKVLEGYPRQISQDFFSCTPSSNSFR